MTRNFKTEETQKDTAQAEFDWNKALHLTGYRQSAMSSAIHLRHETSTIEDIIKSANVLFDYLTQDIK